MGIRFNPNDDPAKKYLPPTPEKPTIEELTKDLPNIKELKAAKQARMNSIIEGIKSFAAENFKFNSGNSVFTDSANLKNDVTEK